MDFCTDKSLYLFAEYIRLADDREVLAAIRRYLADAGVLVDAMRRAPEKVAEVAADLNDPEALIHAGIDKWRRQGKTESWIDARVQGIFARNQFTAALKEAVLNIPRSLFRQSTEKNIQDFASGRRHNFMPILNSKKNRKSAIILANSRWFIPD